LTKGDSDDYWKNRIWLSAKMFFNDDIGLRMQASITIS
jgi:hypothetical protein